MTMTNPTQPENLAARRYGYARVGVSTPDHDWVFGFVQTGMSGGEKNLGCQ